MERPAKRDLGFSLIELILVVVIIGIVVSVAVPKMNRTARSASGKALKMDLARLYSAIELYAVEHAGKPPDQNIKAQLTQYSDFTGSTTDPMKKPTLGIVYGPYLTKVPSLTVGSKNGANEICHTADPCETPATADVSQGWWYNIATREIVANLSDTEVDEDGVPYNTYTGGTGDAQGPTQ